jgi:uncharacterized protein YbaR (Trm112 family)
MASSGHLAALLELVVCPACRQQLDPGPQQASAGAEYAWLCCRGCSLYYPIQDGIPVMLTTRASLEPPA